MARGSGGFAQDPFRLVLPLGRRVFGRPRQHEIPARIEHGLAAVAGSAGHGIAHQRSRSRVALERPRRPTSQQSSPCRLTFVSSMQNQ